MKKIYVGNLNDDTQEHELRELFEPFGQVESCVILTDRETGRSRGFGFVEMTDDEAARKAIGELDGADLHGRHLKINEARPRFGRPMPDPTAGGRQTRSRGQSTAQRS